MPQITIEESTLRELLEKAAKEAATDAYKRGWYDAALGTRIVAEKVYEHRDILMAVADSLQETADALPSSHSTEES